MHDATKSCRPIGKRSTTNSQKTARKQNLNGTNTEQKRASEQQLETQHQPKIMQKLKRSVSEQTVRYV